MDINKNLSPEAMDEVDTDECGGTLSILLGEIWDWIEEQGKDVDVMTREKLLSALLNKYEEGQSWIEQDGKQVMVTGTSKAEIREWLATSLFPCQCLQEAALRELAEDVERYMSNLERMNNPAQGTINDLDISSDTFVEDYESMLRNRENAQKDAVNAIYNDLANGYTEELISRINDAPQGFSGILNGSREIVGASFVNNAAQDIGKHLLEIIDKRCNASITDLRELSIRLEGYMWKGIGYDLSGQIKVEWLKGNNFAQPIDRNAVTEKIYQTLRNNKSDKEVSNLIHAIATAVAADKTEFELDDFAYSKGDSKHKPRLREHFEYGKRLMDSLNSYLENAKKHPHKDMSVKKTEIERD